MERKTNTMYFNELKAIVQEAVSDIDERTELFNFIDRQLAILGKKKEATLKRVVQKRVASDELKEAIFALLTNEFKTTYQLTLELDREGISRNKVIARLSRLVKEKRASKQTIRDHGKLRVVYRLFHQEDYDAEMENLKKKKPYLFLEQEEEED